MFGLFARTLPSESNVVFQVVSEPERIEKCCFLKSSLVVIKELTLSDLSQRTAVVLRGTFDLSLYKLSHMLEGLTLPIADPVHQYTPAILREFCALILFEGLRGTGPIAVLIIDD